MAPHRSRRLLARPKHRARSRARLLVPAVVAAVATVLGALVAGISASAGAVTPSQVQATYGYANHGTSVRVVLRHAVRKGDLVAVYALWSNVGGAAVRDSHRNGYAIAASRKTWAGGYSSEVWYSRNVAGGSTSVTARFGHSVRFAVVYVHEYSGLSRTAPLDRSVTRSGYGYHLSSTVTSRTQGDLIFGAGGSVGAVRSAGRGYTVRSRAEGNLVEDRVAGSAGRYTATATHTGGGWVMQTVAFRPATFTQKPKPWPTKKSSSQPSSTAPTSAPAPSSTTAASTSAAPTTGASSTSPAAVTSTVAAPPPSSSSSVPSSTSSAWPGPDNTGVPSGVTLHSCPLTITTSGSYDACSFSGSVTIKASNVTITRSLFVAGAGAWHGVEADTGQTGLVISDSTVDCQCPSTSDTVTPTAVDAVNTTLVRVEVEHAGHGVAVGSNVVIRDSWIHGLGGNTGAHKDGIYAGDGSNVVLKHNNIDCNDGGNGCTSAIGILTDFGPITHWTIDDNLLNTIGSFCLYGAGGPQKAYGSSYITVTNNHFGTADHPKCGYYGPVTYYDTSKPGMIWSGNVWEGTGAVVSPSY